MFIDHVTIRTTDLEATRIFFITLFDLEEKKRPKKIQAIPGHWLFHKDQPLIHLIGAYGDSRSSFRDGEAIDHVGIRLEGYHDFLKKLQRLLIHYSLMDLPEIEERRIFFHTPGRVLLEAVFKEPLPYS